MHTRITTLIVAVTMLLAHSLVQADSGIVVYSARNQSLIKPLFDAYSQETQIPVAYLTGTSGALIKRLETEGKNTPADMLITTDVSSLWLAADKGLLSSVDTRILRKNIPKSLRDPQGRWFALSRRARAIIYSTDRVDPDELSTYADLAKPKWKGKLCLQSSQGTYNQSLVAMLIYRHGEELVEAMVKGWVANAIGKTFKQDTALMKAIESGECDVGIANTYYFGRLQAENKHIKMAVFWPDQNGTGVHINIAGAGITANAPHPEKALDFLEWLSAKKAQLMFAGMNLEYPVHRKVNPVRLVAKWGDFKADDISISESVNLQVETIRLMDRAGYK